MLIGKSVQVTIGKKPAWFGVVYTEPQMAHDENWYALIRDGDKLKSIDTSYLEFTDGLGVSLDKYGLG